MMMILWTDAASGAVHSLWWHQVDVWARPGCSPHAEGSASMWPVLSRVRERGCSASARTRPHRGKTRGVWGVRSGFPAPVEPAEAHDEARRTTPSHMHMVLASVLRPTQSEGTHPQTHWRQSISLWGLWQTVLHQEQPTGLTQPSSVLSSTFNIRLVSWLTSTLLHKMSPVLFCQ